MLEYLFSNKNVEKILVYLYLHKRAYATELSKAFESALDPVQKALRKLEEGGLLVSFLVGKTRLFEWNPRYPFLDEIQSLMQKVYEAYPKGFREKMFRLYQRKRPRKTGKPYKLV